MEQAWTQPYRSLIISEMPIVAFRVVAERKNDAALVWSGPGSTNLQMDFHHVTIIRSYNDDCRSDHFRLNAIVFCNKYAILMS